MIPLNKFITLNNIKYQHILGDGLSCRNCDLKNIAENIKVYLPPARECEINCPPNSCYKNLSNLKKLQRKEKIKEII